LLRYFEGYLEIVAIFIQRFLAEPWLGNTVLDNWRRLPICIKPILNLWESCGSVSLIANSKCFREPTWFEVKCLVLNNFFFFFGLYLITRENYLSLGEHKTCSYLESLGSWQILVLSKLFFQLQQLLTCEGCTRPPCLSKEGMLRAATCNKTLVLTSYPIIYFTLNFVPHSFIAIYKHRLISLQTAVDIRNSRYPNFRNWGWYEPCLDQNTFASNP